jgi:hypothetical protein
MTWEFPRAGKQYGAYARVPICRACGNPYVPPGDDGCCSVRCVRYLEVAHQPVLGNSLYCQRDEPITCWGCQLRFRSSGLRVCPECVGLLQFPTGVGCNNRAEVTPVIRHDAPISDRNPRSSCLW